MIKMQLSRLKERLHRRRPKGGLTSFVAQAIFTNLLVPATARGAGLKNWACFDGSASCTNQRAANLANMRALSAGFIGHSTIPDVNHPRECPNRPLQASRSQPLEEADQWADAIPWRLQPFLRIFASRWLGPGQALFDPGGQPLTLALGGRNPIDTVSLQSLPPWSTLCRVLEIIGDLLHPEVWC